MPTILEQLQNTPPEELEQIVELLEKHREDAELPEYSTLPQFKRLVKDRLGVNKGRDWYQDVLIMRPELQGWIKNPHKGSGNATYIKTKETLNWLSNHFDEIFAR